MVLKKTLAVTSVLGAQCKLNWQLRFNFFFKWTVFVLSCFETESWYLARLASKLHGFSYLSLPNAGL